MAESKENLEKKLEDQKKRRKATKEDVEKKKERLDDYEGITTLGSLKSNGDIKDYLRRRGKEKK